MLFFGTLEPRKNVGGLLDAYERLARRTASRGDASRSSSSPGKATDRGRSRGSSGSRAPPLAGHVRHIGYVDAGDRRALYEGARLLVQPSFDEGFGMPVLEAMTLGVPVVAANRGSLPEVLGDAGLLVDPDDPATSRTRSRGCSTTTGLPRRAPRTGIARARALPLGRHGRRVRRRVSARRSSGRRAGAAGPSMRIGIDARELCGRPTGVGRYLGGLLHEWAADRGRAPHEFVLYAPEPLSLCRSTRAASRRAPIAGAGGTLVGAGAGCRAPWPRDHLDVWFAPAYTAPLRLAVPTVVAIHDLSFVAHPEWFRLREGVRRRWLTSQSASRAAAGHHDLGVLEARADRAARTCRTRKIHVIPPGIGGSALGARPRRQSPVPSPQSLQTCCSSARSSTAATSPI